MKSSRAFTTKGLYIFAAFLLTLVTTGCANDLADIGNDDAGVSGIKRQQNIVGVLPQLEPSADDAMTRSTLAYRFTENIMRFSWTDSGDKKDVIGVFSCKDDGSVDKSSQQQFKIREGSSTGLSAKFEKPTTQLAITKDKKYLSYFPIKKNHDGNNLVHISFTGQIQKDSPDMRAYFNREQNNQQQDKETPNLDRYLESEATASAHLSEKDYLVSSSTSPEDDQLYFHYTRLVSIVRFYIRAPHKDGEYYCFDSIQVINKDADFIVEADMDIMKKNSNYDASTADYALTNLKTSHIISLAFNKETTVKKPGTEEDITVSGFEFVDKQNKYHREQTGQGYIIAYMMLAPINLRTKAQDTSSKISEGSTLYLIGHDINGNKKVFRSNDKLAGLRIMQNKYQQWTPDSFPPDEPIEVTEVEVEEWKEDTTFKNSGSGTADW